MKSHFPDAYSFLVPVLGREYPYNVPTLLGGNTSGYLTPALANGRFQRPLANP